MVEEQGALHDGHVEGVGEPVWVDGWRGEGVLGGDVHGAAAGGPHERDVEAAGIVVEDLVGGDGGVEEGGEDEG